MAEAQPPRNENPSSPVGGSSRRADADGRARTLADAAPRGSGRIFISYRRQETSFPAGWLFDRLVERYGDGQVFKDVDSVEPGDDFVEVLTRAVGSCEALLAVIGTTWNTITDEQGRRRLHSADDFVRLEIEAALERDILVIPILVDGAVMPPVQELPASLTKLARRQALELSPSRFEYDTNRLLKVLNKALGDDHGAEVAGTGTAEAAPPRGGGPVADDDGPVPGPALDLDPAPADPGRGAAPPPQPPPAPHHGHGPSQVPRPVPARPMVDPGPSGRRRRWLLLAALAAAVVVAASGLLLVAPSSPEERPPASTVPTTRAGTTTSTSTRSTPEVTTIKVGRGSSGVAVGPRDVWVSNYDDGTVTRLDPASGQATATIGVGKVGGDVVACPDAAWVISDSRFVARIDAASRQVTGRIQISAPVVDLAVRCGDAVWTSGADGTVSRIRHGASVAESFLMPVKDLVADVDVDAQGVLWMSHPSGNRVLRLDPATKKVQPIAVGAAPIGVAAAQLDAVWVTGSDAGTITRIDPSTNTVVRSFPVGRRPWGAAVDRGTVWVTNLEGASVSRLDIASGSVSTVGVGSRPDGVAAGHGAVWVANGGSGTVSRIT